MQNKKVLYTRKATMWNIQDANNNITNTVTVPRDGMISISSPPTARVSTYVNNSMVPTQSVEVKEGDEVFFRLTNYRPDETPITLSYEDSSSVIMLAGMKNKEDLAATKMYSSAKWENKTNSGDKNMAEVMTPGMIMGMGNGGGDGLFGGGGGGGLIGGLILGSLLRNGGNLLGNEGAGAAAALRSPPEQATANMSLMQAIGAVDKAVAVSSAAFEASQAVQSLGLTNQFNNQTQALSVQLMAVNQEVMENRYELAKDIAADGAQTRALIVAQYEATLNRQLTDANAEIIALRNRSALDAATNGINVTNTNNINQMQQQTQSQQQYANLAHLIYGLGQNITNGAINVGSGTLTANPTNTNTSIR
jgi:hypothetical protein